MKSVHSISVSFIINIYDKYKQLESHVWLHETGPVINVNGGKDAGWCTLTTACFEYLSRKRCQLSLEVRTQHFWLFSSSRSIEMSLIC